MTGNADYAEAHDLWQAIVEIALVNPEQDVSIRSYLIAAPDETEAEHILGDYQGPGDNEACAQSGARGEQYRPSVRSG